jgi:hypothetical protein
MTTPIHEVGSDKFLLAKVEPHPSQMSLPLCATFFPLGFPVVIATNSSTVLEAASQSWGKFRTRFDYPPLTLHLEVSSEGDSSSLDLPDPICHVRRHLVSTIADPYNFVHSDINAGFAFGFVTPQTAASSPYLRYHMIEAAVLCMIATLRAAPLHAACVSANGYGMLLCGDSGAGKSSLAFAGARSGWAFTCDDSGYLLLDSQDRRVIGNCHQFRLRDSGPQLFPELEGRSITPRSSGKPSIEIPIDELPGLVTRESADVESIIFLNRSPIHTPELVPISHEPVRPWFLQFPYPATRTYLEQREAIDRLLDAPIFELRYTDLDWAIERLNALARTGH